ncbi:MAG: hypothetical protein ACR2OZ_03315 [Verrucomicrobiales bacterium]
MSPFRRNCLLSALASAILLGGVHLYLQLFVIPLLIEKGNRSLVAATAVGITNFYSDFQRWPGPSMDQVLVDLLTGGVVISETSDRPGENAKPVAVGEPVQLANYLRDLPARRGAQGIVDAWGRPLKFGFPESGPAQVASAGRDGRWDTADDVSIEAPPAPKNMRPSRSEFLRAQAFLRAALENEVQQETL